MLLEYYIGQASLWINGGSIAFTIESKSLFINREDPAIKNQLEPGDHDWKWIVMVLDQWRLKIRLNKVEVFLIIVVLWDLIIHICQGLPGASPNMLVNYLRMKKKDKVG